MAPPPMRSPRHIPLRHPPRPRSLGRLLGALCPFFLQITTGCVGPAVVGSPSPGTTPPPVTSKADPSTQGQVASSSTPCQTPVDARTFGAGQGAPEGDGPAIQRAIRAASAQQAPCVQLPSGDYVIRQAPGQALREVPIRPEVDGLTLEGAPDGTTRILLEADSFAILVNKGDTRPLLPVRGLRLRHLTIEVPGGHGVSDAGAIQLNRCPDVHVADVRIRMNARAQVARGLKMSGLATSQGTSGLLERIHVDGISKAGMYLASGTHHLTVRGCETLHAWNEPPINAPPPGLSISDAHEITVVDHHAHHNRGAGLLIGTNGGPPIRVPELPSDAYGAYYPGALAHGPATRIRVVGGSFSDNGEVGGAGILIGSGYPEVPREITLTDVLARGNRGPGIVIEAGADIAIDGAVVSGNGAQGILVRDVVLPGAAGAGPRTTGVRISNALIHDNGRAVRVDVGGLEVRGGAEGVGLIGGIIAVGDEGSRQRLGVRLVPEGERRSRGFFTVGAPRIAAPILFDGVDAR
ncbi:right-handed parallel beta-helix repeat-containing protein [Chondromyces crocatus]|uniref:Right handed beta helix domain-containing protein n=1 Tax=Chondromyces crocatus TaxID=52 RepID=A0A0K1EM18_CHOCO|nr:right-handed parallel beta-helix repeat-containing protein [Chondromyces crocatus]AKT41909.1 uncharacterized protein CMC5_061310 [Chondromyces crocatus]